MNKNTEENLLHLDDRLIQGYDRSLIMKSEKANRASYYTEKVIFIIYSICL